VDHIFVLGKGPDATEEPALVAEQSIHGDLLGVDCIENCLEKGKTFLMYLRMYELVRALKVSINPKPVFSR
jgi:hypothetical protein